MYRKLTTVAAVAALTLGLAACGGGGSDGPTAAAPPPPATTPDTDTDTDMTPVTVTIDGGMLLSDDNSPVAGVTTIPAGGSHTSGGVVFDCAAGGPDCELTVADDGTATSTGGTVTASLTDAATMQVAAARAAAAQEQKDRIIGEDKALEAAANIGPTVGPAEGAIIINRGGSGPAVVTSAGYTAADDAALSNGDVWIGSRLTQAVAGVGTNQLVVYTDKEPATRIQFYNWDGDATTPSLYADPVTDALLAGQAADSSTVITPLGLGGAGQTFSAATTDRSQFPQPQLPEEGSRTRNYANNADANGQPATGAAAVEVRIPGNYNGAGGQYQCTGGPCSVTVAPDGSYTFTGAWFFLPELNATAWLQDGGTFNGGGTPTQRGEFMSFGWWLQEPTAQTGVYTFRYYADGTAYNLAAGNLNAGSAVYNGRAAGRYVVQTIDDGV